MMVLLIELYLFIPFSVTLTVFQGHNSVGQVLIVKHIKVDDEYTIYKFYTCSGDIIERLPGLTKTLMLAF